jgi:hypothetical protein
MKRLLTALTVLASACGAAPTDETSAPEVIVPPPLATEYTLVSDFDVTAAAVAPGPVYDALSLVRGLREAPADTLFALLDQAGVPAIATLRDALPGVVEDELADLVDDALEGAGVADELDWVIALSETTLTRFALESTLDVAAGEHRARAITFHPPGLAAVTLPLPAGVGADVDVSRAGDVVTIGAHGFGLPLGELAFQALETTLGASLRDWLGTVVPCDELAATVADRCLLGVCVGHEDELRDLCALGLDEAAEAIEERFLALDHELVHFDGGAATCALGELVDGRWTAQIDVGAGLRSVPAVFHGTSL